MGKENDGDSGRRIIASLYNELLILFYLNNLRGSYWW